MKKQIINGAQCFTLSLADQLKARDQFLGRMAQIPKQPEKRRLYAAVAAEVFKETFPKIAMAIEAQGKEKNSQKKRPIFIQGFRMGRVKHNLRKGEMLIAEQNQPHTSEPELALLMAASYLLDPQADTRGSFSQNRSVGPGDEIHDHPGYAVVAGQHGVDGVKTRIWYRGKNDYEPEGDFAIEVKRGSLLIIPPNFQHEVDEFHHKITNKGVRNTVATFIPNRIADAITEEELEMARKQYYLLTPRPKQPAR